MPFGATVPPSSGGHLPTQNSTTGQSDRYYIHDVRCTFYQKSQASGNTVDGEMPSIEEMRTYLQGLEELPGGIQCCEKCIPN